MRLKEYIKDYSLSALTRRKPVDQTVAESKADPEEGGGLKRALSTIDLVGYGIGCTVGAGIYSMIGQGALDAGPAVSISFIIGAISCALTGLAYSEFASRIPVAGSAYTYAYCSFGELIAWTIGWDLTLEYAISAAVIARSGAEYFVSLLEGWNIDVPSWISGIPLGQLNTELSIPSFLLVMMCTLVMLTGCSTSSKFNILVTMCNLLVLTIVVIAGLTVFDFSNWTVVNDSFVPYGVSGIFKGAGAVFFTFIGFDMVSCLSEEVENPQRSMPIGILGSLFVSACLYTGVSLVVTGMDNFLLWGSSSAPLWELFTLVGMPKIAQVVAIGSVFGSTTATFTCLLGQPRIFYRMSKDGLLFKLFSNISPRVKVPVIGSLITGVATALLAFFTSLEILSECISIGTLFAFTLVDMGVITLRYQSPEHPYKALTLTLIFTTLCLISGLLCLQTDYYWVGAGIGALSLFPLGILSEQSFASIPSTFKCPFLPYVPCAGIAVNMFMLAAMTWQAWVRLFGWMILGYLIYFLYGIHQSGLKDRTQSSQGELLPISKGIQEIEV